MSWMLRCLAAGVVAPLAGCGGEPDAELRIPSADARPKSGVLPEKTATHPASPCDWIPAVEVEAVVGKLSGPPRKHEGGCFYPLPLDSITIARRAKTRQVEEALARAGMNSDWPAEPEDTAGVLIQVDVGVGAEERPVEQAFAMGPPGSATISRSASTASSRCSSATACWRSPTSLRPRTSRARSASRSRRCRGWADNR